MRRMLCTQAMLQVITVRWQAQNVFVWEMRLFRNYLDLLRYYENHIVRWDFYPSSFMRTILFIIVIIIVIINQPSRL